MNVKAAKKLRKLIRAKYPNLSKEPTYNLTAEEFKLGDTLYLTADCQRFFYKRMKSNIKKGK